MKSINKTHKAIAAASLVLLALAGCGGDDDNNNANNTPPVTTPPTTPPVATTPTLVTAAASIEGLLAYMKVAIASLSETAEPIDVTAFVPPTSETIEPDPSI